MKSAWSNWKDKGKRGYRVQQAPLFSWEDYILKTDECSIHEIKEPDLADVRIPFTDDEVRTYFGGAYDRARAEEKLRSMMMGIDNQGFTVRRTSDSTLLGLIETGPYHNGMEQEISYQFTPEVRGQGYAKEAIHAALVFLSEQGMPESILAETQKKNIRPCRLLEALGFKMRESLTRFRQPQMVYMRRLCKSIKAFKAFDEMLEQKQAGSTCMQYGIVNGESPEPDKKKRLLKYCCT